MTNRTGLGIPSFPLVRKDNALSLGFVINLYYHLPEAARSAGKACWEKYNSEGTPYGTCDAAKPKPCAKRLDDP